MISSSCPRSGYLLSFITKIHKDWGVKYHWDSQSRHGVAQRYINVIIDKERSERNLTTVKSLCVTQKIYNQWLVSKLSSTSNYLFILKKTLCNSVISSSCPRSIYFLSCITKIHKDWGVKYHWDSQSRHGVAQRYINVIIDKERSERNLTKTLCNSVISSSCPRSIYFLSCITKIH